MNSSAYEQLYAAFVEQQSVVPFYVWSARIIVTIGLLLVTVLVHLIFRKVKGLSKDFSWALFYSLLCPTLMSIYLGIIFTPYFIIPYDIVWNYGFFRTSIATHIESISGCAFCVPHLISLIFLGIIYMKAFFKAVHFQITKTLRSFFYTSACGIICAAYLLIYFGLGSKQDLKQSIVIDGDPRNEIIFRDYGGFVVNFIDPLQWFPLHVVLTTLRNRREIISKETHGLQFMLIRIFILHTIIFISFYVLPVIIIFAATRYCFINISRYPIAVIFFLNLCLMPTTYCLAYLYFVNPIKRAFLRIGRKPAPVRQSTTWELQTSTGVL